MKQSCQQIKKNGKKGEQRNSARFPSISGQSQRLSNVSRVSTFSEETDIFNSRWRRIFSLDKNGN